MNDNNNNNNNNTSPLSNNNKDNKSSNFEYSYISNNVDEKYNCTNNSFEEVQKKMLIINNTNSNTTKGYITSIKENTAILRIIVDTKYLILKCEDSYKKLIIDLLIDTNISVYNLKNIILEKLISNNLINQKNDCYIEKDIILVSKSGVLSDDKFVHSIPYIYFKISKLDYNVLYEKTYNKIYTNNNDELNEIDNINTNNNIEMFFKNNKRNKRSNLNSNKILINSISSIDNDFIINATTKSNKTVNIVKDSSYLGNNEINKEVKNFEIHNSSNEISEDSQIINKSFTLDDYKPKLNKKSNLNTKPKLEELVNLTKKELENLNNFIVYNNYGKIEFLEPVDLTYITIDDIISIDELNIRLYNSDYYTNNIPSVGEKLNVISKVTIFGVEPPSNIISNEELQNMFLEDIKLNLINSNAKFIGYFPNDNFKLVFEKSPIE